MAERLCQMLTWSRCGKSVSDLLKGRIIAGEGNYTKGLCHSLTKRPPLLPAHTHKNKFTGKGQFTYSCNYCKKVYNDATAFSGNCNISNKTERVRKLNFVEQKGNIMFLKEKTLCFNISLLPPSCVTLSVKALKTL